MALDTLGKLGKRALALGGDAASKVVRNFIEQLPSLREKLDNYLEEALEQLTSIDVVVSCVPTGPLADDYALRIEHSEFDAALKARRFVQPHIIVKAARPDLDRSMLTERMLEGLAPVLASYKVKADKKREEVGHEQGLFLMGTALLIVDTFTLLFYLALVGAGALVGPILWLLVGIGGFVALKQVPGFVISTIKNVFFGTEVEQLEAETKAARKVVEEMVNEMEIVIDPNLN